MATVPDELADVDYADADESAVLAPLPAPLATWPPVGSLLRLSVAQYDRMIELGILDTDDQAELIEGLVVKKMTKGPTHEDIAGAIHDRLHELKTLDKLKHDRERCRVKKEGPLSLPAQASEPEPDVMLLVGDRSRYVSRHPEAADTLLVVEVADTSLAKDRRLAAIYAAAGVPRYLLVDVATRTMTLHEQPAAEGYAEVRKVDVVPVAVDGEELGVLTTADVFPPEPNTA